MSPRRRKAEDADVFAAAGAGHGTCWTCGANASRDAAGAGVAGALVQRFGSKRALLLAHARYAADTGDVGIFPPWRG